MPRAIVIDEKGIRTEDFKKIDLKTLYSVCCKETPENQIVEAVYQRFSDKRITIWCHEEGRLYPLPVYGVMLRTREDFAGPLLITSSRGSATTGLTDAQIELVSNEIIPVRGMKASPPHMELR